MRRIVVAAFGAALAAAGLAASPGDASSISSFGAGPFTDVPSNAFYSQAVQWAADADVTQGTSPTTFSPNATLDRKDGITLLWRANGSPLGNPASGFTDVPAGTYYTEAVNWAKAQGITTGTTPTTFEPTAAMSRAMYATMIWRAAGSPTGAPSAGFSDVPAGAYYETAVDWMKAEGITVGISPTEFGPSIVINRAMGVTFLWRNVGSPVFTLNIFHVNDHHSNLEADDVDIPVPSGEVEVALGGFARVVSVIDHLRAHNAGENNVTVHAGDAITGTLFYTLFGGEADAAMMNEVCFDMFALGNHEFDGGDAGLATFLGHLSTPECDTPVLAANVVPKLGTPLFPSPGGSLIQPYHIEKFGDDAVAFVGIDIKQKTEVSSQPDATTSFLDEVTTAQNQIDLLTALGYDKIGLVTHQGYANDLALASMVSGVDFIVGGDSHTLVGDHSALGLGGTGDYPTITSDLSGNRTCVVQAWEYSQAVGSFNIGFDDNGRVTGCGGQVHFTFGDVTPIYVDPDADPRVIDTAAMNAARSAVDPVLTVNGQRRWTEDSGARAVLDGFAADVDVLAAEVIGTTSDDLCLARFPYQDEDHGTGPVNAGRSSLCTPAQVPNGGEIQQVVTDAFLARSFRADIALQNSGGVRVDIGAGDVTIADAYQLLPFSNTLIELDMTGAEILTALEQGLGNVIDNGGSSGAYPYGSGIRWNVDISKPFGSRFSNVEVQPKGTTGWVAIDPGKTYVVVANSFMANGGDGYEVLADVMADGRGVDTFLDYAQSFVDWIVDDKGGTFGDPTDFSTQSYVPVPAV